MLTIGRARRRRQSRHALVRCGLGALLALVAFLPFGPAACIFDNGKSFEGGGRRDTSIVSPTATDTAVPTTSTRPGTTVNDAAAEQPDAAVLPFPDASDQ